MLSGINACLYPLALPLGYLYPIFIFIHVFSDSLSLFSLHQGVRVYSNVECMGTEMACIVPV